MFGRVNNVVGIAFRVKDNVPWFELSEPCCALFGCEHCLARDGVPHGLFTFVPTAEAACPFLTLTLLYSVFSVSCMTCHGRRTQHGSKGGGEIGCRG